jgi:hypothetical protein
VHAGDPGDDPVGLPQSFDEPRDRDDFAAVALEEGGRLPRRSGVSSR